MTAIRIALRAVTLGAALWGGSFAFAGPPIEQGQPTLINQPGGGSLSADELLTDDDLRRAMDQLQRQMADRYATQSSVSQLLERLSEMEREVQQLRGQNDELTERLRRAEESNRERYADLDRRLSQGQTQGDGAMAAPDASDMAVGDTSASEEEQRVYRRARDLIAEREYERAVQAFGDFVAEFPDSPLVDDAWYWRGEVHTLLREFSEAETAYSTIVEDHPDSDKRIDALFKLGFVAERGGNTERAREYYEQVLDEAPDSSVGSLASQRLEGL